MEEQKDKKAIRDFNVDGFSEIVSLGVGIIIAPDSFSATLERDSSVMNRDFVHLVADHIIREQKFEKRPNYNPHIQGALLPYITEESHRKWIDNQWLEMQKTYVSYNSIKINDEEGIAAFCLKNEGSFDLAGKRPSKRCYGFRIEDSQIRGKLLHYSTPTHGNFWTIEGIVSGDLVLLYQDRDRRFFKQHINLTRL